MEPREAGREVLEKIAEEGKYTFISTGMSTIEEIDKAVAIFNSNKCQFELMHCVSTYPMDNKEANLKLINKLGEKYNCKVGYSGHEKGLQISIAAVAMGATSIERHITLDRTMWGTDQSASLEPISSQLQQEKVKEKMPTDCTQSTIWYIN